MLHGPMAVDRQCYSSGMYSFGKDFATDIMLCGLQIHGRVERLGDDSRGSCQKWNCIRRQGTVQFWKDFGQPALERYDASWTWTRTRAWIYVIICRSDTFDRWILKNKRILLLPAHSTFRERKLTGGSFRCWLALLNAFWPNRSRSDQVKLMS